MSKKGLAALVLTAAVAAGAFSFSTARTVTDVTPSAGADAPVVTVQAASAPSASKLAKAVKKAYGNNYLPNFKLGKNDIKDK